MGTTNTITVTTCAECPFFQQTAAAAIAAMLTAPGQEKLMGVCDAPAQSGLRHHPAGAVGRDAQANRDRQQQRMKVRDGQVLPESCPLRSRDVLVTLGS